MGLLFALLSTLCFVVLDILRKVLGQYLPAIVIAIGINLGAAVVFGGVLVLSGEPRWDETFVVLASLRAVAHAAASLLFVQAVTLSPLSLTMPYLAFTPVVSAGVAALVLHEEPSLQGLLGIGLVGIGALALHAERDVPWPTLVTAPLYEPGSWRMLLVAAIWGTTSSLDKIAIAHSTEAFLAFWIAVGSAFVLAGAWWIGVVKSTNARATEGQRRQVLLLLSGAAVAAGGAVLFQLFAYRELFVAYVATIKRSGSLLSVVLGAIIFDEDGLSQRLPAAVLMTLGVAVLTL